MGKNHCVGIWLGPCLYKKGTIKNFSILVKITNKIIKFRLLPRAFTNTLFGCFWNNYYVSRNKFRELFFCCTQKIFFVCTNRSSFLWIFSLSFLFIFIQWNKLLFGFAQMWAVRSLFFWALEMGEFWEGRGKGNFWLAHYYRSEIVGEGHKIKVK